MRGVLDLDMGHESGFVVLNESVPDRNNRTYRSSSDSPPQHDRSSLALEYGAHACLVKSRTSPETLCRAIDTAIASLAVPLSSETTLKALLSVHADFQQLLKALGLSMKETRIVLCLHHHPGAHVQYIADRLGVALPDVECVVEKLIEEQIVRSDVDEMRTPIWFLTRKGVRLAAELETLTLELSRQTNQGSNSRGSPFKPGLR